MINLDELLMRLGKTAHILNELYDARVTLSYSVKTRDAAVTEMQAILARWKG